MIRWKGPYGDTDIPAGQRFEGWSEYTTGAGTFKNRYRDGDSLGAHHWRELAADINRQVAMSQQPIWQTGFVGPGVSAVDGFRTNTFAYTWDTYAAWMACQCRVRLLQSPRRGAERPPRLLCRVRTRAFANSTGASEGTPDAPPFAWVRVYSTRREGDAIGDGVIGMMANSPTTAYAEWTLNDTAFPGTPGWSSSVAITLPRCELVTVTDPAGLLPDVEYWETHLVLASRGTSQDFNTYFASVAAIEVIEEIRGGTAGSLTGGIDQT